MCASNPVLGCPMLHSYHFFTQNRRPTHSDNTYVGRTSFHTDSQVYQ